MNTVDNIRFYFLSIHKFVFGKEWIGVRKMLPYSMFWYVNGGEAELHINKEKIKVSKDQIVYIPRGCRFEYRSASSKFSITDIRFMTSVYYEGGDVLEDFYGIPRVTDSENEKLYFSHIYNWSRKDSHAYIFFIKGYMNLLIASLCVNNTKDAPLRENGGFSSTINAALMKNYENIDSRIQAVLDYISVHPAEKYTLESMAGIASLSKSRFRQLFKDQMGKSPKQYLREIRMTMAARLLLESDEYISGIGYQVGYEDPNYFAREFKLSFGITPKKYREMREIVI
jgi:AraC-like DNA-binding protein